MLQMYVQRHIQHGKQIVPPICGPRSPQNWNVVELTDVEVQLMIGVLQWMLKDGFQVPFLPSASMACFS